LKMDKPRTISLDARGACVMGAGDGNGSGVEENGIFVPNPLEKNLLEILFGIEEDVVERRLVSASSPDFDDRSNPVFVHRLEVSGSVGNTNPIIPFEAWLRHLYSPSFCDELSSINHFSHHVSNSLRIIKARYRFVPFIW
jgi:hypothetical protein